MIHHDRPVPPPRKQCEGNIYTCFSSTPTATSLSSGLLFRVPCIFESHVASDDRAAMLVDAESVILASLIKFVDFWKEGWVLRKAEYANIAATLVCIHVARNLCVFLGRLTFPHHVFVLAPLVFQCLCRHALDIFLCHRVWCIWNMHTGFCVFWWSSVRRKIFRAAV